MGYTTLNDCSCSAVSSIALGEGLGDSGTDSSGISPSYSMHAQAIDRYLGVPTPCIPCYVPVGKPSSYPLIFERCWRTYLQRPGRLHILPCSRPLRVGRCKPHPRAPEMFSLNRYMRSHCTGRSSSVVKTAVLNVATQRLEPLRATERHRTCLMTRYVLAGICAPRV